MLRPLVVFLVALTAGCARPAPASPTAPACTASSKPFTMKPYVFVLLRRGPAWTPEQTPETKRILEGHLANIKTMARAKTLVLAGPLDADDSDRSASAGIFIFDTTSHEEVRGFLAMDPAVASGRLEAAEIRTWYGPSGLTYDGVEESLR